jgi:hypothetical protein
MKLEAIINQLSDAFQVKKCVICKDIIYGQYYTDNWGQAVHTSCKMKHCYCCGRIISTNGKLLADGRDICEFCLTSVVVNQNDIQWVDERILAVLKSVGIVGLPKVPIEIVEKSKLNQLMNTQSTAVGDSYGLAQYTALGSQKQFKIFILDHLPKTFFAGVLAHEYMHVWQYQNNINPPRDICEGFCNLGSMAFYQKINTPLSKLLLEQMKKSPDPIYGEGYRKVLRYRDKNNWIGTIKQFKINKWSVHNF